MNPVLVFDLDDTLFPEHEFVRSGFRAVDRWLEAEHALKGFAPVATMLFERGDRGHIFDDALAQLGWTEYGIQVSALVAIYREHYPDIALHEDARWALEHFRSSHQMAILTDGFLTTQRRKVSALALDRQVDTIVYSDEFGRHSWKPSRTPYNAVMERLGCLGREYTYVSDNPAKDFISANEIGWRTIRIRRSDGEYRHIEADLKHSAHAEIQTLYQLGSHLKRAVPKRRSRSCKGEG
jgi:putative hydrolase of the HAD superfamily